MSSVGRMENALFELWWGYEDGEGQTWPGLLADLPLERVTKLIDETIDAFLTAGWKA